MKIKHRRGEILSINLPHGQGANGLDLSEAIIIVDYIAIKNTPYKQIFLYARVQAGLRSAQDQHPLC